MKKLIAFVLAVSPLTALAQTAQLNNINDVANRATSIGNLVIGLAIAFAIVWIIVSIVRYLIAGGEEDRKKGGLAILYGVIGLVVILSIWGLVALVKNSFNTGNNTAPSQVNNPSQLLPPVQNIP